MKKFKYTITDPVGIHARPAGNFVKAVKNYEGSKVTISGNGKEADAKKLMAVMTLGIKQGQEVELTVEGGDEDKAFEDIKEFMKHNL
ncbi:MAG TPA: HPr family phosphocarrier protein [Lachnospiraceae bacterium]|jgi:phosphocarrier protein|nr:HPr family phosphocarrier protein [Lachnospiraceae bacterium]